MSKYTSVLEKALPQVNLFAAQASAAPSVRQLPRHHAYAELAARLFEGTASRSVVAFVAVHPGEGVTSTVRGLAAELGRSGKTVAALDGALRSLPASGAVLEPEFERGPTILGAPFAVEPKTESAIIPHLHEHYDCVLLDCGALETSVDLLRLAPATDGIVLVVEAGRTRKDQLDRAMQVIREAQGKLIGFVLNKRRYPIPTWLYSHL